MNYTYLTSQGFKKLQEELNYLTSTARKNIANQISEAVEKGDLSENAEYDAAKEAQAMLENRISMLQEQIMNVRIVDATKLNNDTVQLLSKVTLKNVKTSATMVYIIAPAQEADFKLGKISIESPIAKGLIGKKKGDIVHIDVPSGKLELEIIEITC